MVNSFCADQIDFGLLAISTFVGSYTQKIRPCIASNRPVSLHTPIVAHATVEWPSLAAILSKRKERTKLGLSKYAAEAAEQAAEHRDKLGNRQRFRYGLHTRESGKKKDCLFPPRFRKATQVGAR